MTRDTDTVEHVEYNLNAALDYADLGLPVFPCKRADKSPLTPHGFKDATTNRKRIKGWWREWPEAMIGIPTGRKSGIDVLDIDLKPDEYVDGFARWMEFLRQLWPGNGDGKTARYALQEIFGLMLTPDTTFQKIFAIIGPKRAGKGTIARILCVLLGKDHVAGPTGQP